MLKPGLKIQEIMSSKIQKSKTHKNKARRQDVKAGWKASKTLDFLEGHHNATLEW